jgi:hypothetical protein
MSYLEIGAKFGGSLKAVAAALPSGARIVAVDLPGGTGAWKQSRQALIETIEACRVRGQDAHIIWGDSTDAKVVGQVRMLAPFDAILIDANHTLPYVTQDWSNYAAMGRMIAFHDIAWYRTEEWVGTRIDVPQFWNSLKGNYYHKECKLDPTKRDNGIGVLWR